MPSTKVVTMKKFVSILCLFGIMASCTSKNKELKTFDPAFVHTVYFWLKDPENIQDRTAIEASLKKFMQNSKYAQTKFVGKPPKATRDIVDDSFTYALVLTFSSAEEQENYQKEEAHLLFIEESQDLWKKVLVYDSRGEVVK
jgi:hypothetical protein